MEAGPRKRNSPKSMRTRERLKQAAWMLFEREGHSGVSAKAITDACGLSTAAFFRYYKGKRELLLDICKDFCDLLIEGLKAEPLSDDVYETMCQGQFFYFSTIVKNWKFYRALVAFSLDEAELRDYLHTGRLREAKRTADMLTHVWKQSGGAGDIKSASSAFELAMILNAMSEGRIQDMLLSMTPETVPDEDEVRERARFVARVFYRATLLSEPHPSHI